MDGIQYPYLLVNVGSGRFSLVLGVITVHKTRYTGVGFILVTSDTEWKRVSGTSIGRLIALAFLSQ
jgi:hypothetical protein